MTLKQLSASEKKELEPTTKAPSRARKRSAAIRASDDPLAALSATRQLSYKFEFDVAGLEAAVDDGPTKEQAAEVFASDVQANMQQDTATQLAKIDPQFLTAVVQAVLAIVQACSKQKVTQALDTCQRRPRGLAARNIKLQLARRLPGPWTFHAVEVSRTLIDTALKDRDTDLFTTLFPEPAPQQDTSSAAAVAEPEWVPPVTDGPPPAGIVARADVMPAQPK